MKNEERKVKRERPFLFCLFLLFLFSFAIVFTGCEDDDGDKTYTVTFNENGGTGTTPAAQTVSDGSSITLPPGSGLSRSGYVFSGWNTSAYGTGTNYNAGESYTVTSDITLYAKWNRAASYTVTFDINGGNGTAPAAQTAVEGSGITIPPGDGLFKAGYSFGGWNTNAGGTGTNYNAGASFTVTRDITLYAKWVFTVTFNSNGGDAPPTPQSASQGSSINLPSASRSGYTFGRWNTNIGGTGTNYAAGASFTPTGNITLYAQWDSTILFNANNGAAIGAVPASLQIPLGSNTTIPNQGTLSLFYADFGGWNTNAGGTGTNYNTGASFTPNGNITLYVKWNINTQLASVTGIAGKLDWLQAHAQSGGDYTVDVTADASISPQPLFGNNRGNIKITLSGSGHTVSLSPSSTDAMFRLNPGVTLVLDGNITLKGHSGNDRALVRVIGGTFTMNNGTITGNTTGPGGLGGGVYVGRDITDAIGTFTMTGGTISGNTAPDGGGVFVDDFKATFTMTGGTISGNTATSSGGGVFVKNGNQAFGPGILSKTGGTITGYADDTVNGNVVRNSSGVLSKMGHAAFIDNSMPNFYRDTTAGTGWNLTYDENRQGWGFSSD